MGRKLEKGYSLANLTDLIKNGTSIELSAMPVGEEHEVFFRIIGNISWIPVVSRRKDGPLSYKSEMIGALMARLGRELPNIPLRAQYIDRVFSDSKLPDPISELLRARYANLKDNHRQVVFTLLNISPEHKDPVWEIERALTYPFSQADEMTLELLRRLLHLPEDWR
jgi:hypothetical protein